MTSVIEKQHIQTPFLSAEEAVLAARPEFQMSVTTVKRLSAKGHFPPPTKVGGRSFWDPVVIAAWKAARIQEARTQSTKQSKE